MAMLIVALLLSTQAVFAQRAARSTAPNLGNVDGVSAAQLRRYLEFIASDELEGRDTPSRGLDIAAMYIAGHLASWGIKPAGDNGRYFQKVPLRVDRVVPSTSRVNVGGMSFEYGKDFLASVVGADVADTPIVFAGYGWVSKKKNMDPYAGIDVKDKIVVVVNAFPKGLTNDDLPGPPGVEWASPPIYCRSHGAKALINFASFNNLAGWEGSKWAQTEKGSVAYEGSTPFINASFPTITASPALLAVMFRGESASANSLMQKAMAGEPIDSFEFTSGKRMDIKVGVNSTNIATQNVVGVIEGTDPVLKNEYVAIGAHYDHVGMNPYSLNEDKIWNGADDDGSGTVSVLSIAEAIAKGAQRPKRSILFIWHAGEEKGLWGSDYFTSHPTVPIGSIITELNIDMIGRYQNPGDENHPQNKNLPKPGEIFTIGNRMMSTELGDIADAVNKSYLNLKFDLKYDGPDHPEQFFYRSDHFNYAKRGVPIIFFMDGSHADYHQPSDSVEKINFEQMEKVVRTIMATAWELANRAKRPTVDKPLPASVTGN